MDLLELAERCEKATGPDRSFDEAIAEQREPGLFCRDGHGRLRKNLHGTVLMPQWDLWQAPNYTSSLDAAVMLVPEGYSYTAGYWTFKRAGRASVWIVAENETREVWTVDAATPALALCAAALRARYAQSREKG